jgi:hypothetical protein
MHILNLRGDMEVTVSTFLPLDKVKKCMKSVIDGHYMADSVCEHHKKLLRFLELIN